MFMTAVVILAVGFVWGWYRHNSGKPGFDDWDRATVADWPRDWHKHE